MALALETERFTRLLGTDRVLADAAAIDDYSGDMTEIPSQRPGLVVKPRTTEEVAEVVKLAAAAGTPVTPAVARMNVGGLTIPAEGGIIIDLSDMNRVVELDRDNMYAVIEPGVTFAQMKATLDEAAPELTISYPLSPPHTSILANWLLDGLGSLSLPHGSHGEHIGGLEVVLPDGTIAKTGACAGSPYWFGRGPLPDLTGLFVNWHGSSGIVTKIAAQLWRRPKLSRRLFVFCGDLPGCFALVRDLSHAEVCRDLSAITWPTGKMVFGVDNPRMLNPGEPEVFVYFEFGADDDEGLRYKEKTARRIVAEHENKGLPVLGILSIDDLVQIAPSLGKFAEFPMTLDFLLDHPGGGLTWVGTYGPVSAWEEGAARCRDLMVERGFPPLLVTRPMKGAHFGVLRMITLFDKNDAAQIERVRTLNSDLLEVCLELGFIPYKAPDWAVRAMHNRLDPGFLKLLDKISSTLDPEGIMNPERWPLPG